MAFVNEPAQDFKQAGHALHLVQNHQAIAHWPEIAAGILKFGDIPRVFEVQIFGRRSSAELGDVAPHKGRLAHLTRPGQANRGKLIQAIEN